MTDDQRRDALRAEMIRYARIINWRRMRLSWVGDERPDAVTIVATARLSAAKRLLVAITRAGAINDDIPF